MSVWIVEYKDGRKLLPLGSTAYLTRERALKVVMGDRKYRVVEYVRKESCTGI